MPALPTTPTKGQGGGTQQSGTPGSWTHPKYEEILRRKDNSTFTDRKFKQVLQNGAALFFSFFGLYSVLGSKIVRAVAPSQESFSSLYVLLYWVLIAARIIFFFNILQGLAPLFMQPDPVTDIPLTPSQRHVLGLPPTPTSVPPSGVSQQDTSQCITPPRYNKASPSTTRSSTPITPRTPGSPSRSIGFGRTLITSKGSPVPMGASMGQYSGGSSTSGFDISKYRSPSPVKGGLGFGDSERRHSFGSPSPKGMGLGGNSLAISMQSSVSPSVVAGAKWLFEQKNKRREYI